jgi:protein phosphatase
MSNDLPSQSTEAVTEPGTLARSAVEARPDRAEDECAAMMAAVGEQTAALLPADAPDPNATAASADLDDDELEELVLPSLVRAPELLTPGTKIGTDSRARIVEHLGTQGRVNWYAATWRQDDGQEIEVELREGPADHAGLQCEAEILAAVQYAMLPRFYGTWEEEDRQYLAIERLHGETLDQTLAAGLPADRALSIVVQLAQVVRRLHQAGWALLGLTPSDMVLGQPVRIAQLGHAGRIGEPPPQALHLAGYSAPELAYREAVTGKEDVYTLGALLYHALAGARLSESGVDLADLSAAIRLPGGPQLLADLLTPADERLDIDALYRRLLALKSGQAAQSLSLEVASATTLGLNPTRLVNEDSCAHVVWSRTGAAGASETAVLCVADGMGGMEAGEIASQTAIDVVMDGASHAFWPAPTVETDPEAAGPTEIDPVALVQRAATAVHGAAQGRQLGTTITCIVVQGGELTLAHVGDTRAYLLRDGALSQLTADHSLVAAMVTSGVISSEEARGHPDSNKVLRSLGSQRVLPDGYVDGLQAAFGAPSLHLAVGDWLMLCSDGVWGTVEDRDIQIVLTEALDCQRAASALVDRALKGGAPDNATIIVARCVQRPAF